MGGSLKQEEIQEIKDHGYPYTEIKNFVETGTYKADSTIIAAKNFDNVYTIEIFEPLYISGCDSGWNGTIRVPLIEELDIILSYKLGPSVFIFDDLRLWKTIKAWDWEHITNEFLVQKFKDKDIKLLSYFEKDDRFYIYTK